MNLLSIDNHSGVPIFRQIQNQVRQQILDPLQCQRCILLRQRYAHQASTGVQPCGGVERSGDFIGALEGRCCLRMASQRQFGVTQ